MKLLAILTTLAPTLALAGTTNLPELTREGQELCYVRAYSKDHLTKHPNQKIKGAAVSLTKTADSVYATVEVRTLDNKTMFNAGGVLNAGGTRSLSKIKNVKTVAAQMDSDGGRFLLTQLAVENNVALKVQGSLYLAEANCTNDSSITDESKPYDSMLIEAGQEDSIMVLERKIVNGSTSKTCSQILDQQVYLNN
jgi:hypothetical protein